MKTINEMKELTFKGDDDLFEEFVLELDPAALCVIVDCEGVLCGDCPFDSKSALLSARDGIVESDRDYDSERKAIKEDAI